MILTVSLIKVVSVPNHVGCVAVLFTLYWIAKTHILCTPEYNEHKYFEHCESRTGNRKRNVEVDPLILKGGGGITGGRRVEG